MLFDLYLILSIIICIALIIFIITFGIPMFTGAPFAVSTPFKIKKMLPFIVEAIGGRKNLSAVDIGSGDGRIIIALAREGLIAHGIEINPFLAWFSKIKIKAAGLKGQAFIHRESFWHSDFSQYDIVVLFGVFYIMKKLEKKLMDELKPGAIIICNHFYFPNWTPIKQEKDIYIYRQSLPTIDSVMVDKIKNNQ
jgi:Protein-L-isoaspartate carboxylmethyltransferase